MVSNLYVPPQSEIFNTYGEDLTNAQLVARYGFSLSEGNDNDVVSWDAEELCADLSRLYRDDEQGMFCAACSAPPLQELSRTAARAWPREDGRWRGSSRVVGAQSGDGGLQLHVNSDARASHHLWLFCAVASILHVHHHNRRSDGGGGGGGASSTTLTPSNAGPPCPPANAAGGGRRDVNMDALLRCLGRLADRLVYLETQEDANDKTLSPPSQLSGTILPATVPPSVQDAAGLVQYQSDEDDDNNASIDDVGDGDAHMAPRRTPYSDSRHGKVPDADDEGTPAMHIPPQDHPHHHHANPSSNGRLHSHHASLTEQPPLSQPSVAAAAAAGGTRRRLGRSHLPSGAVATGPIRQDDEEDVLALAAVDIDEVRSLIFFLRILFVALAFFNLFPSPPR
ncbi:hypothetical protein EIP91_010817 [Steccherinum ochraceum]|uniref:SET domain-containing protein n=1 Tax=Steccherinum ochraceum TaxID=92696 RepID=A0A4R0RLI0_9APHY|nr:hypothetical protein EIP91_010817 [Steccherinum ochraceum]